MSVSKWAWTWACDHGICIGDCDLCERPEKLFGNWKKTVDNGTPMLECSACGCRVKRESFMDAVGEKGFSFCPYCGADLRKGEDVKPRFGRWIAMSEKVPEDGLAVIVTIEYHGKLFVRFGIYMMGIWFDHMRCQVHDDEHVIAWMPLPEPYGGSQ